MSASASDTIAAIATPTGEGGIAVIRVSGALALAIAASVFRPASGKTPTEFTGYSVHYGQVVAPNTSELLDDGLLTVFRAPHSYTGEETVELSCHGGRQISRRVLEVCVDAGARLAEPGEFTQRAFLNGKLDLAQAEAVADLIRARTDASVRLARRQLEGGLSAHIAALRHDLIGILAAIEVTIDFSDEVGDLNYIDLSTRIASVLRRIDSLLATAEHGRILREGLRVAIVGKPNVGKSSLLNALLHTERAIVTPIAGTTRDTVEEALSIQGIPVVLVDTAGIRNTEDVVEQIGVDKARSEATFADVVLFVIDSVSGIGEDDRVAAESLRDIAPVRLVVALNKADLKPPDFTSEISALFNEKQVDAIVAVSATTGDNLAELEHLLVASALDGETVEATETVLVTQTRHRVALEEARESLGIALATANQGMPGDFVAIDVRGALDSLGLITGETVTDEIVHRIFSDFCVGK